MSQPHLHNVLKNIRALSPSSADRLMQALGLTVAEILWEMPGEADTGVAIIPIVRHRIGPGALADLSVYKGVFPLPKALLIGLIDPVLARLSPDLSLPSELSQHDLVLLDRNPEDLRNPDEGGLWVVSETGGMRIRHIRVRESGMYTATQATLDHPDAWRPIKGNILDVVRARIVWISRTMEKKPAEPPGRTGAGD
jgi:hypothetical protein